MNNIQKIFISGHSNILSLAGKIAEMAILGQKVTPVMMPFPASAQSPANLSLDKLSACDAVVLLIGKSCGAVWQNGLSITELEYEKARELELNIFAFIIDDASLPETTEEDKGRLELFIKRIQKEITYSKTTITNLKQEIEKSMQYACRYKAFLQPDAYFRYRIQNTGSIFEIQPDDFIGREHEIQQLNVFYTSEKSLCFVKGPTGCGKSHLLYKFAKAVPDIDWVGFWNGLDASVDALQDIRSDTWGKGLVIIECTSDTEIKQVSVLIQNILRLKAAQSEIKIIVSMRDYMETEVNAIFGYLYSENNKRDLINIPGLPDDAVMRDWIVSKTLPVIISNTQAAAMLHLAGGLPLPLKICISLVKSRKVDIASLSAEGDFQKLYLKVLADDIICRSMLDTEKFTKFLRLTALLSPFLKDDAILRGKAAELLKFSDSDWLDYLDRALELDVIQKKGRYYRVYPDILGDYLADTACYSGDGLSKTDWIREVIAELISQKEDVYSKHFGIIIRNLAESWYRRHQADASENSLWGILEKIFDTDLSNNFEKLEFIKHIKKASYYNPAWALAFAEKVIQTKFDDYEYWPGYSIGQKEILQALSPLIYHAAFHVEQFPKATDLLWELALQDNRETNHSEHPLQLLCELANYKQAKPLVYTELLLTQAQKWLDEGKFNDTLSPLHIFKNVFAKKMDTTEWYASYISVGTRFLQPADRILNARNALSAILSQVLTGKYGPLRIKEAIDILAQDLAVPIGVGGARFTLDLQNQWRAEQLKSLTLLAKFVDDTAEFIPKYWVFEGLKWAAQHHSDSTIKKAAQDICAKIKTSPEYEFYSVLLAKGWDDVGTQRNKVAKKILLDAVSPEQLIKELARINELRNSFKIDSAGSGVGALAHEIAKANPAMGLQTGELLATGADFKELLWLVNPLIEPARGVPELFRKYIELVHWIFDNNVVDILQYFPQWYCGHAADFHDEEWAIVDKMIANDTSKRNLYAFYTLRILATNKSYYGEVKKRILELPGVAPDDALIANSMCQIFAEDNKEDGLKKADFTEDEARTFTLKFVKLNNLDLDTYWLDAWLGHVGYTYPNVLFEFFIIRLEYSSELPKNAYGFSAIPSRHELSPYFKGIDGVNRKRLLLNLVNIFNEPFDDDSCSIRTLFWHVGIWDTDVVCAVFTDIILGKPRDIVKVIKLLNEAPSDFTIKPANLEFIRMFLTKAFASDELFKKAVSALISSTFTGVWSSSPGKPPQKFVDIVAYCDVVLSNMQTTEPLAIFLTNFKKAAEAQINSSSEWEEEASIDA
jgi:hypothetical protein